MSTMDELIDYHVRQQIEFYNSAAGRAMQEHIRRMSDPVFQMMTRVSENAALRVQESKTSPPQAAGLSSDSLEQV